MIEEAFSSCPSLGTIDFAELFWAAVQSKKELRYCIYDVTKSCINTCNFKVRGICYMHKHGSIDVSQLVDPRNTRDRWS